MWITEDDVRKHSSFILVTGRRVEAVDERRIQGELGCNDVECLQDRFARDQDVGITWGLDEVLVL